jgi:hypothetical protein
MADEDLLNAPAARIVAELVALVVIGRPRRPDGGE